MNNRSYWVVSPNVKFNEGTVAAWRQASVIARAAFMGWSPEERGHKALGYKFAHVVSPGDVILIARRHRNSPEIVGFGVVQGEYTTSIPLKLPQRFSSLRKLRPFLAWSRPPAGLPLMKALPRNLALTQLHPDTDRSHRQVCRWMERQLEDEQPQAGAQRSNSLERTITDDVKVGAPPKSSALDYLFRTKSELKRARKVEYLLLQHYREWLQEQGRTLSIAIYKRLQCDGFEEGRRNLIEAKGSGSREHIRMAVGQLLDYSFQGREKFGQPNMAILLPEEPDDAIQEWLSHLSIKVIWHVRGVFVDNADGQFT